MTDKTTTIRIAVVTTSTGRVAAHALDAPGMDWALLSQVARGHDWGGNIARTIVTATVPLPEPAAEVEADKVEAIE